MSPPPQEILKPKVEPKYVVPNSILEEKEEDWINSLWNEIQEDNVDKDGKGKAPLAEINLEKKQVNIEIASRYQALEPTIS